MSSSIWRMYWNAGKSNGEERRSPQIFFATIYTRVSISLSPQLLPPRTTPTFHHSRPLLLSTNAILLQVPLTIANLANTPLCCQPTHPPRSPLQAHPRSHQTPRGTIPYQSTLVC